VPRDYRGRGMNDEPILEARGLSKDFRGFTAVAGLDLRVRRGTIHALIGPNGAGKTTVFNLLTKFLEPSAGRIFYRGREIQNVPSDLICHQGLARSFQITNLFKGLSIYENLPVAAGAQPRPFQPLARYR